MGSTNVTGNGPGSPAYNSFQLGWVNNLFSGQIKPDEFRALEGVRENIQDQFDRFPTSTNTIYVAPETGNFHSIKDAMDSIVDSSNDNRYIIRVASGIYIEDTIEMKQFVSIQGDAEQTVAVYLKDNPTEQYLFYNNNQRGIGIYDLVFFDCPTVVKYRGNSLKIDRCRIRENVDLVVDATDVTGSPNLNYIMISNCTTAGSGNLGSWFDVSNSTGHANMVFLSMISCQSIATHRTIGKIGIVSGGTEGANTMAHISNCCFYGDGLGNGIECGDGTTICVLGSVFRGFIKAVYVPNQGDSPNVYIGGSIFKFNTKDIVVEHISALGAISVLSCKELIEIVDSASISIQIQDIDGHGYLVSGDFNNGETFSSMTNLTPVFQHEFPAGLLTGGSLSRDTGLFISVDAGDGYLYEGLPQNNNIKYVSWETQSIELTDDKDNYLYIDSDGVVNVSFSVPDFYTAIFLGRVFVDNGEVFILQNIARKIAAAATGIDKVFKYYIGPIFASGAIVSIHQSGEPLADTKKLDVSSGNYCLSTQEYHTDGGEAIEFSSWYRNTGGGWPIITKSLTDVPTFQYDKESSGLTTIEIGEYVKHLFCIYGGELDEPERYFLVYGQEVFSTQELAESGNIPSPPYELTRNIANIAAIIVKRTTDVEGQPDGIIVEVLDERPILGIGSSTATVANVHGNLLALLADDHPQYLLAAGTRSMTGDLNMGGKNISSVGTVDGVDVSSHVSRHLPTGSDPLPTAAPNANLSYNSINYAGALTSLSKSDHTHKIVNNYGSFYDTTTQRNSLNNAKAMTLNTTDVNATNNVAIISNSRIRVTYAGVYNLQFSAQLNRESGSGSGTVSFWLRKDGSDVPDTCTDVLVVGSAGKAAIVAAWNFVVQMNANQYLELMWSTDDTTIVIPYVATRTGPIRPAVPSLIATLTQVG